MVAAQWWAIAAAVVSALLYGVASVAEAAGARVSSAPSALVRSPVYLAGLACDGAAWLLSLVALARLPLFVVQPVLTASLVVTAVLGAVWLKARLGREAIGWGCVLLTALVELVWCAGDEHPTAASTPLRLALVIGAVVCAVAVVLCRNRGAAVLAVIAGLAFSGAAIGARILTTDLGSLIREPVVYAIVVFGVMGGWAYAAALERGHVTSVTATLWAVEVVVPTVIGLALLGDTVRPGSWPVLGFAVGEVLVATIRMSRAIGPATAGPPAARPVEV